MAQYRQSVLTSKGQELLAKTIAGLATITFTTIKTSDTKYTEAELPNLTGIGTIKQTASTLNVSKAGDSNVKLNAVFTNITLAQGYYVRNFGIYVTDPTDTANEILYAVVNANESTEPASHLPAYNGIGTSGIDFNTILAVSSASDITVTIDPSGSCSITAFNNHVNTGIYSEDGLHGIRYFNDTLSVKSGEEWVEVETGKTLDGKLEEINEKINELSTIKDTETQTEYKWGVQDGKLYIERVS